MQNTGRLPKLGFAGMLLALVLAVAGCSDDAISAKASFEIGGVCDRCPSSRLTEILKLTDGVQDVQFEEATSRLTISFDSVKVTRKSLIATLNDAGYDVDDNVSLSPGLLDACCVDQSALEGMLKGVDTTRLDAATKARLLDSLKREVLRTQNPGVEGAGDGMDDADAAEVEADILADDSQNLNRTLENDILGGDNAGGIDVNAELGAIPDDPTTDLGDDDAIARDLDNNSTLPAQTTPKPQKRIEPRFVPKKPKNPKQ